MFRYAMSSLGVLSRPTRRRLGSVTGPRRAAAVTAAAVSLALLGACGQGGGGSGAQARFRAEVDRLCEEANGRGGPLLLTDPSAARQAFVVRKDQLVRTRALTPPPGDIWDQAEIEGFLSWLGNVVVRLEVVASAQERGDRALVDTMLTELRTSALETREAAKTLKTKNCATI